MPDAVVDGRRQARFGGGQIGAQLLRALHPGPGTGLGQRGGQGADARVSLLESGLPRLQS